MFTSDQSSSSSTSILNLCGGVGAILFCCILGGFTLGCVLFISYVMIYQVIAVPVYLIRHVIRLTRIERELTAARTAAGVLALPKAIPASAQRIMWGGLAENRI